ncbi:UNVERIFIED_CONTAM: hypothetical protein NCL1_06486 [Trichonephila clavipes]
MYSPLEMRYLVREIGASNAGFKRGRPRDSGYVQELHKETLLQTSLLHTVSPTDRLPEHSLPHLSKLTPTSILKSS